MRLNSNNRYYIKSAILEVKKEIGNAAKFATLLSQLENRNYCSQIPMETTNLYL